MPSSLVCGCLEHIVRRTGHRQTCQFAGQGADAYPWVAAWGRYIGYSAEKIQGQIMRARAVNAPLDAYREVEDAERVLTGQWYLADTIRSEITRNRLSLPPLPVEVLA